MTRGAGGPVERSQKSRRRGRQVMNERGRETEKEDREREKERGTREKKGRTKGPWRVRRFLRLTSSRLDFYLGQTRIRLNALIKLLTSFGRPGGRRVSAGRAGPFLPRSLVCPLVRSFSLSFLSRHFGSRGSYASVRLALADASVRPRGPAHRLVGGGFSNANVVYKYHGADSIVAKLPRAATGHSCNTRRRSRRRLELSVDSRFHIGETNGRRCERSDER